MKRGVLILSGLAGAIGAWHLIVRLYEPTPLPRPIDVLLSAARNWRLLAQGSADTSWRLIQGLLFGFVAASVLAVVSSRWLAMRSVLVGPVEFMRPIPPIALTPFFILLLGLGPDSQIGLVAMGAFMVFYIGWLEGLRVTPDPLVNSARSLGYDGLRLILCVAMPYAWPSQKPIWRLAIATGLSLTVAAEYMGAQGGLGYIIRNARTMLDFGLIAAASILLGAIAISLDHLITRIIDVTSPWSLKSETFDG